MRTLALDVGEKRIGVAVSDALGLTAQGVEVIQRSSLEKDLIRLAELIRHYQAEILLLGFPKNMNGSVGDRGRSVQEFAALLQKRFPAIKIQLWDERLSTIAAERTLLEADVSRAKRRQVIDKMAAVFILQGYLDSLPRTKLT
ncbi:Holliday junction resolvase RuvX [Acetonema longum]|uniref:Putative pre-16S rRNA nuclease n=1 Tax=Acetonema longum DSM 6540 TaxID=1009370 RepID=F7NI88_9FIRM|nr:Holliday junction resolvase RuvX [Acetonema longum]EGO64253.1 Holliday junction resolvase YqgF [Acetonema longum DSM 6540]